MLSLHYFGFMFSSLIVQEKKYKGLWQSCELLRVFKDSIKQIRSDYHNKKGQCNDLRSNDNQQNLKQDCNVLLLYAAPFISFKTNVFLFYISHIQCYHIRRAYTVNDCHWHGENITPI